MDEVIRCKLVGVGSVAHGELQTNPTGRQTWVGVRVRTADGKSRFFPGMVLEAEAAIILLNAMDRGETVELWLTGKTERASPYGIRTATEEWYSQAFGRHLRSTGWKLVIAGILTLPFLGAGVFFLLASVGFFVSSGTFAPRHSRRDLRARLRGRGARADDCERIRRAATGSLKRRGLGGYRGWDWKRAVPIACAAGHQKRFFRAVSRALPEKT